MESAHVFGDFDQLVGILHEGLDQKNQQSDVAVIMLTAGMLHSTGPFRMYVNLARDLGRQGVSSFRFDLSGIGESLPVGSTGTSLERAASETSQAMDLIEQKTGIRKFVLMGLCSGADDGFNTALGDSRVSGVILLDGCGYPTWKFKTTRLFKHYLPRLVSPKFWARKLGKLTTKSSQDTPASLQIGDDIREFPSRDVAAKQLQQLVDRDVKLNFVYTGGVNWYYNHEQQFNDMFADVNFKGNVSHKFFPHMDHVAFLCEDRKQLLDELVSWTTVQFPAVDATVGQTHQARENRKCKSGVETKICVEPKNQVIPVLDFPSGSSVAPSASSMEPNQ